jgi:hypothetical protein
VAATLTMNGYIQLLQARVGQCSSIDSNDRILPVTRDSRGTACIVRRGSRLQRDDLFANDRRAAVPFRLARGGELEVYLRLRPRAKDLVEVVAYRLALVALPSNPNGIDCLRFDRSEGKPGGEGWDEDLGDNPHHPWAHLHVNFASAVDANACRMPTGSVCPIVVLRAFDHWYYQSFVQ